MKRYIATTALALAAFGAQAKDIVDTAIAAGQFNTLAAALDKAGLVSTLKGKGPLGFASSNGSTSPDRIP